METENVYSVEDILQLLWSHIILIITVTLCGGIIAFAFSKLVLPLKYSSHITMYVQSYRGISENNNNTNNISNSKQLVNTYIEVLKDDTVMSAVGEQLSKQYDGEDLKNFLTVDGTGKVTPGSIRNCLSISSVTDTSAVKVVATTLNPELAADICNNLTKVAPKYVEEAVGVGSINTIDRAKVNARPVAPNMKKNTALGMAAAFLLCVMLILLVDYFDNTIKESDDVGKKYNTAIIGEVQQFYYDKKSRDKKSDFLVETRGLFTDRGVPFNVVESYKKIRANMLFAVANYSKKVIAVSSPDPAEGKSTSAANLAIVLAQTGSKVLLIDADMRKPTQHKTFHEKNGEGLSTLIINESTIEESVRKNISDGVDLLPAGPTPPNPSELLASENFKNLIQEFSYKYDYIIIDTPPVNVVSDAMVIKDSICGIVLIVRYAKTTFDDLSDCMKQIELANINTLGLIINDIHHKHGSSYYNYKYKNKYSYGKYGEEPENGKEAGKKQKRKKVSFNKLKAKKILFLFLAVLVIIFIILSVVLLSGVNGNFLF